MKEVDELFHWLEQVIELEKEKEELANRRELVAEKENSSISLLREKGKEVKDWQSIVKKLSKNLNESEMGEFIIGRIVSPQETAAQIGRLEVKLQKLKQKSGSVVRGE